MVEGDEVQKFDFCFQLWPHYEQKQTCDREDAVKECQGCGPSLCLQAFYGCLYSGVASKW